MDSYFVTNFQTIDVLLLSQMTEVINNVLGEGFGNFQVFRTF